MPRRSSSKGAVWTLARTCIRRGASFTTCSPAASRSRARARRRSCGHICRLHRRRRARARDRGLLDAFGHENLVVLESASRQGFAFTNRGGELPWHFVFLDRYALAVTEAAPFRVTLAPPPIQIG